jgi:hypothetical protein
MNELTAVLSRCLHSADIGGDWQGGSKFFSTLLRVGHDAENVLDGSFKTARTREDERS